MNSNSVKRDGNSLIVGLFSTCRNTPNESEKISNMELYSKMWHSHNNVSFESYDVCKNVTRLSEVIERLFLDDSYFDYDQQIYTTCAFVVDLQNELLKHLYKTIWHTGIPIFPLRDEDDFTDSGNVVRSPSVYWFCGFNLKFMEQAARTSKGRVLVVKDDDEKSEEMNDYKKIIAQFITYMQDQEICYKTFTYEGFKALLSTSNWGDNNGVLLVIDLNAPDNYDSLIRLESYKRFVNKTKTINVKFKVQTTEKFYEMVDDETMLNKAKVGDETMLNKTKINMLYNDSVYRADAYTTFLISSSKNKNGSLLNENLKNHNPNTRVKNNYIYDPSKCKKTCPPGEENKYNRTSKEEGKFECRKCPPNRVKESWGTRGCRKCGEFTFSSEDQTKCIDFHKEYKYIKIRSKSAVTCLFISLVMFIFWLVVCYVFYKNRETPIVTTSRFRTSMVHMAVIMMTFLAIILSYIGYPNKTSCIVRPLIVAVLYNCNVCLLLTKSNKILSAYNSKIISSASEVRNVIMAEIFLIILSQAVALCAILISMLNESPGARTDYASVDEEKHTRRWIVHCNTDDEHNIAVAYTVFLKFLCLAQAFRCRKLPSVLNEAMEIVYTCVVAIFFCAIKFIIQVSTKKDEVIKEKVVMVGFVLLNAVIFVFMYGRKTFLILFRPHQNTKKYFQKEFLRQMQRKAAKLGKKKGGKAITNRQDENGQRIQDN